MNLLIGALVGLFVLVLAWHQSRRRRRLNISPTLALVKKRHALRKKLVLHLGDEIEITTRVKAEARRLNLPQSSIEVLEAALLHLESERYAGSSQARRESYHHAQERIQAERGPDYVPDPPHTRIVGLSDYPSMSDFGSPE